MLVAVASAAGVSGSMLTVTEDMLQPILDTLVANLSVLLPFLIPVFGLILVSMLVPRLISRFLHV